MCKVLVIGGIKKEKMDATLDFVYVMSTLMSKGNSDGIGYAAVNDKGELFGERWLHNDTVFLREAPKVTNYNAMLAESFDKVLTTPRDLSMTQVPFEYNSFGNVDMDSMVAITLHTRMATSPKGMGNTHPFVDEDTSLIHNGVITNHEKFKLTSTCDSEAILRAYLQEKVSGSSANVQKMARELYGYYACGVFARDAKGNRILDVFKANNYNLAVAYVVELDTWVISTSDTDIKNACSQLGFTCSVPKSFKDDILMRFNPTTGEMIESASFTSNARSAASNFQRGGTTTHTATTETSRIPYSNYHGAKVYEHGKKGRNLSTAERAYMTLAPGIEEITGHERDTLLGDFLRTGSSS